MARPLTVVDLESPYDAALGAEVTASLHRGIDATRPLQVLGPDAGLDEDAAGIVVTGSPAMVEDVDWALPLGRRLIAAAEAGVPVLGICFGHQLLAVANGGRVASWDEVRTGVLDVDVDPAGPFAAFTAPARLVHTHRDRVVDGGAMRAIARGDGIPALAHPRAPMWSLQGHPEATPATCRAWNRGLERLGERELAATDGPEVLAAFGRLLRP